MPSHPILNALSPAADKLGHIKLAGNEKRRIKRALPEVKDRVLLLHDVLRSLGQSVVATSSAVTAQTHTSGIHL